MTTATTYYADTADGLEPFDGALGKSLILRLDIVHADRLDKTDGGSKGDGGSIVGGSSLELQRRLGKGGARERDLVDHLASSHPWVHDIEKRASSI